MSMMVAINARNTEELQRYLKRYHLKMTDNTIKWWSLFADKGDDKYLCVSFDLKGYQQGGGHICDKHELDSSTIILTTRRRLI